MQAGYISANPSHPEHFVASTYTQMASYQVFFSTIFTFFFFFLPHIISSAIICETSSCGASENMLVKFPYRLKSTKSAESCGYPGFDLSCNNQSKTILTLPYSGDFFVEHIDYYDQSIYIDDPDGCFFRRFLQNFTLSGSPFQFAAVGNFTFFNCSANETKFYGYVWDIPCLSGDGYNIWIALSGHSEFMMTPPSCRVILMGLLPAVSPSRFVQLTWGEPSCGECVADDGYCARKSATSLEVGCFQPSPSSNGMFSFKISKFLNNYYKS